MKIENLCAKNIMRKEVIKILWSTPISELERVFQTKQITGAPVVDDYGKLLGVVSETDIVKQDLEREDEHVEEPEEEQMHPYFRAFSEEEEGEVKEFERDEFDKKGEKRAEDIMTPWTCTASESTPVTKIAAMMVDFHIHRILIVDSKSQLKGIVTTIDLAKVMAKMNGHESKNAKLKKARVRR